MKLFSTIQIIALFGVSIVAHSYVANADDIAIEEAFKIIAESLPSLRTQSQGPSECKCDWDADGKGESISPMVFIDCSPTCGGNCKVYKQHIGSGDPAPLDERRILRQVPCKPL